METLDYKIIKVGNEPESITNSNFWENINPLRIQQYLWLENGYKPKTEAKVCYSERNLFVNFKVYENEVTAKYERINDPVHKDSCVEFFVNLFPTKTEKYFNFEINPLGTIHVGFGALGNRKKLTKVDIKMIEINSSLKTPIVGIYGNTYWEVYYKIPISLFEQHYELIFNAENAKGNFYKCGDESKYEHYGVWNNVDSTKPNFHLPQYFGDLVFKE